VIGIFALGRYGRIKNIAPLDITQKIQVSSNGDFCFIPLEQYNHKTSI
jgi:hypothetical protein